MARGLEWSRDGVDWPHREASRFVEVGGLRWHVQRMGQGPVALLLHGTGSATHTWRGLAPLLAPHFSLVAMDLPGHGFTGELQAPRMSLPGLAGAVGQLVRHLDLDVAVIVGHSAGAAIGARLALEGRLAPRVLVGLNPAFLPFKGVAGLLFPPVARLMAATPFAAHWFARRDWDAAAVQRLVQGTGSTLDATGLSLYARLLRDPRHSAGALAMMSRWDLRGLADDLRALRTPLVMVIGEADRAVPPGDAQRVCAVLPRSTPCRIERVPGAGHLVHEEQPEAVARLVLSAATAAPSDGGATSVPPEKA